MTLHWEGKMKIAFDIPVNIFIITFHFLACVFYTTSGMAMESGERGVAWWFMLFGIAMTLIGANF